MQDYEMVERLLMRLRPAACELYILVFCASGGRLMKRRRASLSSLLSPPAQISVTWSSIEPADSYLLYLLRKA